jgi:hypothetical protein
MTTTDALHLNIALFLVAICITLIAIERNIHMSNTIAERISSALDRAAASMTRATTVLESGVRFVQEITPLMRQSAEDADAVRGLADAMDAKAAMLAQALAANTVAEGVEVETGGVGGLGEIGGAEPTGTFTDNVTADDSGGVTDETVSEEELDAIEEGGDDGEAPVDETA